MALAGCAAHPELAPRPVMVKIPIATPIYCDAPAMQRPPLPIAMLTADSAPADTIRLYAATVDVLKGAVVERDAILKGCATPFPQTPLRMTQDESPKSPAAPATNAPTSTSALLTKLRGLIQW